jgi:hypothetical protein
LFWGRDFSAVVFIDRLVVDQEGRNSRRQNVCAFCLFFFGDFRLYLVDSLDVVDFIGLTELYPGTGIENTA